MKQKIFTFLAMLMFVSVNAVADGIVPVSISAKYGATTFVCNQDLDFSDFCSDPQHIVMKPYYISGYSKEDGTFTLSAFVGATVPAYTPMILLGTAHTSAGETDVITEEVPVISMNSGAADDKRDLAFGAAGGYCWLEPAIASSYTIPDYVAKNAGRGSLDKMDVTFYDNTSKSFPLYVKQTGNIEFGSEEVEVIEPYTTYQVDQTRSELINAFSDGGMTKTYAACDGFIYNLTVDGGTDLSTKVALDANAIIYTPAYSTGKPKTPGYKTFPAYYWYVTLHSYYDEDLGMDVNYWNMDAQGDFTTVTYDGIGTDWLVHDKNLPWNETAGIWANTTSRQDPLHRDVTNFVLSVNKSTGKPVFKKCNSSSNGGAGTKVDAGKCYVRVWNDVLVGAAAAREDIGWTFEEEEDLNSFEENATGIKDVKNIKNKKAIFNMKGQKLEKMQKGLNIVNGKKVYVK